MGWKGRVALGRALGRGPGGWRPKAKEKIRNQSGAISSVLGVRTGRDLNTSTGTVLSVRCGTKLPIGTCMFIWSLRVLLLLFGLLLLCFGFLLLCFGFLLL